MYLTDLADACRTSGLEVVEVDGWEKRGHGAMTAASAIVLHHTATPLDAVGKAGSKDRPFDYPSLGVVRDGRAGLPGPLSHLGLGRDGTVYVIAAGQCYHAGLTFQTWQSNRYSIGIEAEHPGGSTPWPDEQYQAYVALATALSRWYLIPLERIQGHREVASPRGRKTDPTFDLERFRLDVVRHKIAPPDPKPAASPVPEDTMEIFVIGKSRYRAIAGDRWVYLPTTVGQALAKKLGVTPISEDDEKLLAAQLRSEAPAEVVAAVEATAS